MPIPVVRGKSYNMRFLSSFSGFFGAQKIRDPSTIECHCLKHILSGKELCHDGTDLSGD